MSLLSTKAIVTAIVGSGSVVGSGYGVVHYVRHSGDTNTSVQASDSLDSQRSSVSVSSSTEQTSTSTQESEIASPIGSSENSSSETENSQLDGLHLEGSSAVSDDDEEEEESKVSGNLALLKGPEDSVSRDFQLKEYFGSAPEVGDETVVLSGISFEADSEKVKRCLRSLNSDLWSIDDFSELLDKLAERKNKFREAFEESVYTELIKKIGEKKESRPS
ncbi:hypothetical protein MHLP_02145 [Candidatus Mycoplasma haematolamae str. Purdue]|uniref:Uncharacterized protein n=1 Tax=Mycoplasma haematolamae (strain Purdue) TaxID=1212765 RepID=I7CJI2_MYCHA|nr:hypothetical protein [Candidatus Mycoplasma haematolamae]AFO52009.1 hypothetical protein MHLP_02145 [Candidatus Mycoplasma haematolamae str. Purdue]